VNRFVWMADDKCFENERWDELSMLCIVEGVCSGVYNSIIFIFYFIIVFFCFVNYLKSWNFVLNGKFRVCFRRNFNEKRFNNSIESFSLNIKLVNNQINLNNW
jgi:hypothetical protein